MIHQFPMSDTRDEAEQEMVSAGIASGMEDTLGVSDMPIAYRDAHADVNATVGAERVILDASPST